ncbi:MAG: hypothetical protein QOJ58_3470 [Alphaproteobacteria bacterium]|nr:hypothetical protein [Alphaproteobacteria bacterium]
MLEGTFRGPGPHLLTGPIHIEGAEPGDVIEVRVLDLQLRADWGWNLQVPTLGTLPEDFPEFRRIHIPLDRKRNIAKMAWGQELPLAPFFGNFGVAPPPSWGRLSSKEPRVFGGNMDNKELGVGSTVYFPVFVPGALFSAGDGHALQGDGEVCLTAIEAALTGTLEFHLRRDLHLASPRAETPDGWITMGFDEDLDDAAKAALRDMIQLIRPTQRPECARRLHAVLDCGRPAGYANGRWQQRRPLRSREIAHAGQFFLIGEIFRWLARAAD